MKAWDSDLEEADEGAEKEPSNGTAERMDEVGKGDSGYTQHHLQKVQKLIYAAKVFCDLMTFGKDYCMFTLDMSFHCTKYQPKCCVLCFICVFS